MPRVSVVIPTYNRGQLLLEAVRSALTQTLADLEVIVADDGSSDASVDLVEELADVRLRGFEDYDLWLRIRAVSRLAYLPEPLLAYRRHTGSMMAGVPPSAYWSRVLAAVENLDRFLDANDPQRNRLLRPRRAELLTEVARAEAVERRPAAAMRSLAGAMRLDPGAAASLLLSGRRLQRTGDATRRALSTAHSLRWHIWPPEHERSYRRYMAAGGGPAFRYDFQVTAGATILDLGGYHGEWTREMVERFGCRAYVFEPVREYLDLLSSLFVDAPSVVVCPFGLGSRTRTENIGLLDDSSSIFADGRAQERVLIRDVAEWWHEAQPGHVAVAKINIEGGEYEVLPRLIESGLIEEIDEVQVQFHDVVPNAKKRMNEILADLALSHEPTYRYPFVWENWRLRVR
jgi:FkbM family methyltransferase